MKMRKIDRRWIWIALAAILVLFRIVLGNFPFLIEQYYSRGIFQLVRYVNDYTISLLPFPLLYLLIAGGLFYFIRKILRIRKSRIGWKQRLIQFLFSTAAFLSAVVSLFLLLWGFNYARLPLEKQIGIDPMPLDSTELKTELDALTEELRLVLDQLPNQSSASLESIIVEGDIENKMRQEVIQTFNSLDYPTGGRVRARLLKPKGVLLRINTAGFYFPFVGECHVDNGLHPLQIPFVMAHEMAHGYGITDEGSCNFIGYLTCSTSKDPLIRYSGILAYWRYLASDYRAYYPEEYAQFFKTLPAQVVDDLIAIRDNSDKYPDIFPKFRTIAYNTYLKTQGIAEGMKNYDRVVMLATAWRKKMRTEKE